MYGGYTETKCGCDSNAIAWIQTWFGDCVYTSWDMAAFLIGVSSMIFWIIAQLPQFISNFRNQSSDALSPWFLFQWLAGDSFNLLGCLFTGDQLATETLTAMYFIVADSLIISQYVYYQARKEEKEELLGIVVSDERLKRKAEIVVHAPPGSTTSKSGKGEEEKIEEACHGITYVTGRSGAVMIAHAWHGPHTSLPQAERPTLVLNPVGDCENVRQQCSFKTAEDDEAGMRRQLRRVVMEYGLEYGPPTGPRLTIHHGLHRNKKKMRLAAAAGVTGLLCVGMASHQLGRGNVPSGSSVAMAAGRKLLIICKASPRLWWMKESGTAFGWASSGLYLGSRISQLMKNQKRGSAEGLSLAMVACAALANVTYGTAIVMRLKSWLDFLGKAPWLLGSFGTVSLDITLFIQAHYLGYNSKRTAKPDERTPLLA